MFLVSGMGIAIIISGLVFFYVYRLLYKPFLKEAFTFSSGFCYSPCGRARTSPIHLEDYYPPQHRNKSSSTNFPTVSIIIISFSLQYQYFQVHGVRATLLYILSI